MKKIIALFLVLALAVSMVLCLSACGTEKGETDSERLARLQREADAAQAAADQATANYYKLQEDIARYNSLIDAINNAK